MKNKRSPKDLSDIELLERLTSKDTAEEDYGEFVKRFYDDVRSECLRICAKRKLGKSIGEQIAHDTFERVKSTRSFDKQKLPAKPPRDAILAWLYRIESNLFYDYHRSKKARAKPIKFYLDDIIYELSSTSPQDLAFKRDKSVEILNLLNDKEKAVILKDIEYKRLQRYHESEVLEELAEELGVQKASIRKIRERAKNKIKNAIDAINGR